jgi:putative salt-induced outer membrane protein YdiY
MLQVETESSGRINVAKALVETVRSKPEQDAYLADIERLRDPSLLDFWSGTLDTGLSLTRGNAETTTFTNSMKTQRATQRDKISIHATSLYATSDRDGDSQTTANAIRGGTRYDVNLSERLFTFGFLDLEFDEFQNLDLRNVIGGGLGWHIIKNDRTTFDFFSGGSFNQEYFADDIKRKSGELVIGQEFDHKIAAGTVFTEKFSIFPNLSNTGSYRLQFDSGISTKLADWLAWHVTLSDRFQSNPVPGVQKNDVLLTTGVRFSFGAGAK